MSDLKTLQLASLELTEALLEQFIRYERALLAELKDQGQGDWAGRVAFAHGKALSESGIDGRLVQRVKSMVGEFCGKRSAWLEVKQRLAQAEHHVKEARNAGKQRSEKEEALLSRAAVELPRLEDLSEFESRYGAQSFALLRRRELELVELHRDLVRLEGGQGHLHVTARG